MFYIPESFILERGFWLYPYFAAIDNSCSIWFFSYVLAGIIAWGIGCGKRDVPGVYVAVSDAICFIDWVTRCKHGKKYAGHYDYSSESECGENWLDEEIAKLEIEQRTSAVARVYLRKAKELKESCIDDDIDISALGERSGA